MAKKPSVLGANLKRLRLARGLDQDALAAASGLTQAAISALEVGRAQEAKAETVVALARALDVTADELLGLRVAEEAPGYGLERPLGALQAEEKLLDLWRELSERGRMTLMGVARILAEQDKKERKGGGRPKTRGKRRR